MNNASGASETSSQKSPPPSNGVQGVGYPKKISKEQDAHPARRRERSTTVHMLYLLAQPAAIKWIVGPAKIVVIEPIWILQ